MWYWAKLDAKSEEETRKKVKEIAKSCKTIEAINRYLIDHVEITIYWDEEALDTTAYSALIRGTADGYGFCNAMLLLLKEIGLTGEPVVFKGTEGTTGLIVNDKFYSPYVQKFIENNKYAMSLEKWLEKHEFDRETKVVRADLTKSFWVLGKDTETTDIKSILT